MNPPAPSNSVGINYIPESELQSSTPTAPVAAPHTGNWLTHLLPTGGALAGGAGGAALGTAILPGVGTILGGILGAALGGGDAKVAENAAEGQKLDNGVGTTALESGAGQALGGVVGKGLGLGAKFLENRAANFAGKEAAQSAIDNRALALKDVPYQVQSKLNAGSSLDHVQNMGFDATNPDQVMQVGQNSNDVLNSALDKALANSGTFDLSNYPQLVKDALANHSDVLDSYEKVALGRGRFSNPNTPAAKLLGAMENLGMGKATTSSDPNEIRTLTTKLGAMAQKYRGSDLPQDKATYDAINEVRNNVKNALYNRPEVNDALTKLEGNITPDNVGGSQALADHLNNVLTTAGSTGNTPAQDILSEISRNININDLGNEMSKVRQIVSSTGAQARAAADAGIQNANTNEVLDAGAKMAGHGNPITAALAGAYHLKDNPTALRVGGTLGRISALMAPSAGAVAGSANAQLQNTNNGTLGATMTGLPENQGTAGMGAPVSTPSGGLSREDLLTLAIYSPSAFQALTTPSAGQQQNVVTANTAEQALHSLGNAPGGGIMSQIAGKFGIGPTGEYQREAANAAQQVAAALPGSNEQTILKQLTDYNAGQGSIQQAIQAILANLEASKQNNTNTAYQSLMNYQPSVLSAAGL